MFTLAELRVIAAALVVQSKSVARLANKEGQPASVAAEYVKVGSEIYDVQKHVSDEMHKAVAASGKK